MKKIFLCLFLVSTLGFSQQNPGNKPKLVVGIVVDQMRQDYLFRYEQKYGEGGFRRLIKDGFMMRNAHYNYAPTVTGPGHASVFTGTTPAIHGIIGNDWYDKETQKQVNCVNDPQAQTVGTTEPRVSVSPWRLLTSTITDELRLATQKRSRVVGISFKDRAAILPAGHMPNGAYWYDSRTGRFITSTYYMKQIPPWLDKFNKLNLADKYLSQEWNTLLPIEQYTESGPDDSPYETRMVGKEKAVFPYNLKELRKKNGEFDMLIDTPFGDDLLTELAKAALSGEELGKDEWCDFLTVSYSTPDAIGHAMGPNAVEVEDTYLRLDKNIEDLLKTLDESVGKGNYLVFLTGDHAVADVAQYLRDNKIPAGYFNFNTLETRLKEFLHQYFPDRELLEFVDGDQIFLRHESFQRDPKSAGVDLMVATELVAKFLMAQPGVANAYTHNVIRESSFDETGIKGMITRGFHPKRSGDVTFVMEPGWYGANRIQGTTHGSPYTYDTHVPIVFYGTGIKAGNSVRYTTVTDIAPTLSMMLNIKFPNGCTGQPITELFEGK